MYFVFIMLYINLMYFNVGYNASECACRAVLDNVRTSVYSLSNCSAQTNVLRGADMFL